MPRKICAGASFWITLALLTLILPLNWLLAALLAAAFHELGHLVLLRFFAVPVYGLRIRAGGAILDTGTMEPWEELICALAGPAVSFLLFLLVHLFPRLALCALIQGIFNMLPLGGLDGARAARSAFCLVRGKSPCKQGKMRVQ